MINLVLLKAGAALAAMQAPQASVARSGGPVDSPVAIVVTGERVKRALRDTASSVHVVTSQEIETQPVDRVEQILAFVPNVQLGHGSQGPAIRGLDTTGALQALPAFLGGNRPRTTLIVDGRAVSYFEFVFGAEPAWDLERVEVFRSPQTTTQGQNSIAGAIFVYTKDPVFRPEAKARLLAGDFHTRQASFAASTPVNADLAVRIAADLRYSRTTSRIFDWVEGAEPNHDVYATARAKLLVKPAAFPGASLAMTYAHVESQAPQIVAVTEPFEERRDVNGGYGVFRINVDSLTARGRYEGGGLIASLLFSAGDSLSERLAPIGFGQARIAGRDWSTEAVANWTAGDGTRVTGGISLRHLTLNQRIDLSRLNGIPHFRDWQDDIGLFGEADVRLAARATFTAGVRYQRDRQRRLGAFDASTGPIELDYDRTFSAWLPKLALSYQVSQAVTAGVLLQKAFNPGGTTLRFDIGQPDNFEAESLWDYELFARSTFAGGRVTVNANAFYYDMRNAQRSKDIPILAPNGHYVRFADLFNAPKAKSYGIEAEVDWKACQTLTAELGVGLLRTRIVEAPLDYPEFEGDEFDRSPHLTASAAVDWRPSKQFHVTAQVRHHGPYSSDPENRPMTRIGSATIANARASFEITGLSLFAYARNVFDSFSVISRDEDSATLEDPREAGLGLEARF